MACTRPLSAWRGTDGKISFKLREGYSDQPVVIPCSRCMDCRLRKRADWAVRVMHDFQTTGVGCFVTLTMDDVALRSDRRLDPPPVFGSVDVRDWQRFAKRVRKALGPFRFLACGEYGSESLRPHYHAALLGLDFKDKALWKKDGANSLFVSPTLAKLWPFGLSTIGTLTAESAGYVAKYTTKRMTGPASLLAYRRQLAGGKPYWVSSEFAVMSRRPGLGGDWIRKYRGDVFPSDEVVLGGRKYRPPVYYTRDLERENPALARVIKERRRESAARQRVDNTPDQRAIREEVTLAKTGMDGSGKL